MMTRTVSLALWALLWLSSSARAASANENTPPVPWPSLEEVQPDTGTQDTAQLLDWMLSPDIVRRSEAQIRLLALGDTLLPQLEALAVQKQERSERIWMREYLQVLTARQVRLEQLAPYPTLNALAQEAVNQGLRAVSHWDKLASTEGFVVESGGGYCGTPPLPPVEISLEGPFLRPLFNTLAHLGGLARPALERLLSSSSAATRARAMALASELRMRPSAQLLKKLMQDKTQLKLKQREYNVLLREESRSNSPFPLDQIAAGLAARISEVSSVSYYDGQPKLLHLKIRERSVQWFSIANVPGYGPRGFHPLMGPDPEMPSLGKDSTDQAQDEQEYWNVGRPLWRAWWRGEPWSGRDASNLALSFQGLQESSSDKLTAEQSVLQVYGPEGTEVEMRYEEIFDKSVQGVQRTRLPILLTGHIPANRLILRTHTGQTWTDWTFSIGTRTVGFEGIAITLWLHPLLRQAFLERVAQAKTRWH